MLRRILSVLIAHPLTSYSNSVKVSLRMSSEIVNSSKRKPEESECNDSEAKKIKSENEQSVENIIQRAAEETNRVRKPRKAVLLLCYLGKEFYGMQRNTNVSTVEEELFKALLKSKIILQSEFDYPRTMNFQRAARTDKGVSAVRNIVSLKLPVNEICSEFPEKVNQHLPPEIRVVAVKRVIQRFDAKIACDARTYSYMIPTFAFASKDEDSSEAYRITDERIQEVNEFLKNYIGTRDFYNFTSGRAAGDPSCKRYIMSCE
ncbi:tRNA pseudouridine synthase A, partial [Caerostris darwini]